MPWAPKAACVVPGCGEAVIGRGRCATHTKTARAYTDRHHTGATAYNSARWVRLSRAFRAEHPLCANAAANVPGCTLVATEVDHVVPHRGDVQRFFDVSNLQGLCRTCHSRKTHKETDGG